MHKKINKLEKHVSIFNIIHVEQTTCYKIEHESYNLLKIKLKEMLGRDSAVNSNV